MLARRSLLVAATGLLAGVRFGFAAPRGIYDLEVIEAYATGSNSSPSCTTATVTRVDQAARVQMRCIVTRARKKANRWPIDFRATVGYANGAEIGTCSYQILKYKSGPLDLSCDVPLPLEPTLPIKVSGTGPGLSEPFWIPGGSLIIQTTAIPRDYPYADITLSLSTGDTLYVWNTADPATHSTVERVYGLAQARVNSTAEGPWSIVITEAFP